MLIQTGATTEDTWRETVAAVHSDVGYAPATAMLSAYGFYDGKTRSDEPGSSGPPSYSAASRHIYMVYFQAACVIGLRVLATATLCSMACSPCQVFSIESMLELQPGCNQVSCQRCC
jgi:hypothetical protein